MLGILNGRDGMGYIDNIKVYLKQLGVRMGTDLGSSED
jgi:hypothetical protein